MKRGGKIGEEGSDEMERAGKIGEEGSEEMEKIAFPKVI